MAEDNGPDYDEAVVQRIIGKCLAEGAPQTWRDLPADVIHEVTADDIREAARRIRTRQRATSVDRWM